MSLFSRMLGSLGPVLRDAVRSATSAATATALPRTSRSRTTAAGGTGARRGGPGRTPSRAQPVPATEDGVSPGRFGPDATAEVDPVAVGPVQTAYAPVTDGDPDPGEIIWTWVPFEEHDGRGKDRPVLIVATENSGGAVLAVQLTSKDHQGEDGFVAVGSGDWDGEHRPSWVNLTRLLRVHPSGMRREAAALPATAFGQVAAALQERYGWT